jgi:hypothetical protein
MYVVEVYTAKAIRQYALFLGKVPKIIGEIAFEIAL